jgi:hypothetical protein
MSARQAISAQVQIRGPIAVWVLAAHAYATLVPLALIVVAQDRWEYLVRVADAPGWLMVAAALLCAGSAFEVAQNAADHWYLTPDTGSALAPAFCDFLFYLLITAGQACICIALAGDETRVVAVASLAVVMQALCYYLQRAIFAPLAVTGLLVAVLAYRAFGDPLVFLSLPLAALTMYFFNALLRTGAQVLHGFTTASASSGLWFLVWGLGNGADGTPQSWTFVSAVVLAGATAAALAWPLISRLPATPR